MTAWQPRNLPVSPFCRIGWHGRVVAARGVDDTLPAEDDDATIWAYVKDGDRWDGYVVGVAQLSDGRWMAWETFYGPTGSGFIEDAYGGDADIYLAASLDDVLAFGLTESGRRLLLKGLRERAIGEAS